LADPSDRGARCYHRSIPDTDPFIDRRLGHYHILERVGAGGMGVVYRARDERLDRDVALKLLPQGSVGDDRGRGPFKQEALALSRLNHPNVATIHDFDGDQGIDFLVMEFVDGTPVEALIRAGGRSDAEVRRIGVELANGLVALHQHGIVHRDLKPGNLRLTSDGRLKILDFGLARLLLSASTNVTAPGGDVARFAGTLAYMSPEQARGEAADARSDIYAVGAVLYELATGRVPFPGKRGAELLAAIINQTPERPRALNPQLSESLDRTIMRALAKNRAERPPSAADLRGALEQSEEASPPASARRRSTVIAAAAAALALAVAGVWMAPRFRTARADPAAANPSQKITIAVLPFHGQGVPDAIRFLQVGLPDAIITRLAGLQRLVPRPTGAILRYENQTVDPQEAGRTLGSDYVVTGLLLADGERLRISVQLTRSRDGTPMWGDHYDVARADLLTVQDRIAAAIADALKIQMTAAERDRLFRRYTENAAAYERYLLGRAQLPRYTGEAMRAAIAAFEEAVAIDAGNAPARAGLSLSSALMRLRFAPTFEHQIWADRAQREARAALQIDPQLAEAHEALAAVYRAVEFEWEAAIEESRLALALNPHLDQPHFYRAAGFTHLGLLDLIEPEIRAGLDANPANRADAARARGVAAIYSGRPREAVTLLEEVRRLSPGTAFNDYLGQAQYYAGDTAAAEDTLRAADGTTTGDRRAQALLASMLAARDADAEARAMLEKVLAAGFIDHHIAYSLGVTYAQLGDVGDALRWLNEAARTGFPCYPWYAGNALLDPIRGNADFQKLLADLRSAWSTMSAKYGSKMADGL
jgi:TolB-like protein/tRNA A-37 threonylcarbamoyl transferase component Bud32